MIPKPPFLSDLNLDLEREMGDTLGAAALRGKSG